MPYEEIQCKRCDGEGWIECTNRWCDGGSVECRSPECNGGFINDPYSGRYKCSVCEGIGFFDCPVCYGNVRLDCTRCQGTGYERIASDLVEQQKKKNKKKDSHKDPYEEMRARAVHAYGNGWYEESLKDFLECEQKNYQDFGVHTYIGKIYLHHILDLPKALEHFRKAARYAKPSDSRQAAEAEYLAGVVCSKQQKYQEALEHLQLATTLNSQLYEAFFLRAGLAALLSDPINATKWLEVAIKGDAHYHELAQNDQMFDSARQEVNALRCGKFELTGLGEPNG